MMDSMTMPLSSLDSVVCTQTLDKLIEDLGRDCTSRFVAQFCSMWPTRLKRLEDALGSCNSDAGQDAALSLKSGAAMVGARELAELAEWLHGAFRDEVVDVQRKLIAMIRDVGRRSIQALSALEFG